MSVMQRITDIEEEAKETYLEQVEWDHVMNSLDYDDRYEYEILTTFKKHLDNGDELVIAIEKTQLETGYELLNILYELRDYLTLKEDDSE